MAGDSATACGNPLDCTYELGPGEQDNDRYLSWFSLDEHSRGRCFVDGMPAIAVVEQRDPQTSDRKRAAASSGNLVGRNHSNPATHSLKRTTYLELLVFGTAAALAC